MTAFVDRPVYCLTSDVDWASDHALTYFLDLVREYGIKPTIFATHATSVLDEAYERGEIDIGVHPNFLPGSTHGSDVGEVIDHVCRLFPAARSFRSHAYCDSAHITDEFVRRGFLYDSNLCLHLHASIQPLRHSSGLVRFPVFWEDDDHFAYAPGDWDFSHFEASFWSPGLKIFDVHPFLVAANVPSGERYREIKAFTTTLDETGLPAVRWKGDGVETFLRGALDWLGDRGVRFYTLGELFEMSRSEDSS